MKKVLTTLALALMMNTIQAQNYEEIKHTDKNGFSYVMVSNDENGVRVYTLKNGLKVYLAKNSDAPRIQTYIPVRTGSNNDPADEPYQATFQINPGRNRNYKLTISYSF